MMPAAVLSLSQPDGVGSSEEKALGGVRVAAWDRHTHSLVSQGDRRSVCAQIQVGN